ncbi:MAG: DUF4249 domain-containing protein [Catalinimonas sp.]
MKKLLLTVLLPALVLLTGCERDLGVDLPYEGPRLVLFGLLTHGEAAEVRVARTYPPTGPQRFDTLTQAEVVLFENDVAVDTLRHQEGGWYRGTRPLRVGARYAVRAQLDGFPDAESQPELMPDPIRITSYDFSEETSPQFGERPAHVLALRFQDPPNQENFYAVAFEQYNAGQQVNTEIFDMNYPFGTPTLCALVESSSGDFAYRDLCFENGRGFVDVGIELGLSELDRTTWEIRRDTVDYVVARLYRITEAYYDYLESDYQPEGIEIAFTDAYNPYSNVVGGYGLVVAQSYDEITATP